jgi:uncharacterized membrane protein
MAGSAACLCLLPCSAALLLLLPLHCLLLAAGTAAYSCQQRKLPPQRCMALCTAAQASSHTSHTTAAVQALLTDLQVLLCGVRLPARRQPQVRLP